MAKSKQRPDQSLAGSEVYRVVYSEWGSPLDPDSGAPMQDQTPENHRLLLRRERKGRGGKTVTVISGFQLTPKSLTALAKRLKAACGTGGTAKEDTIEIQGDHRQKLAELLTQWGYPYKISGG